MATYNDLTIEQRGILDDFINNQRAFAGQTQRTMNLCASILDAFAAQVSDLLDTITDPNEVIPNKSGLAGAGDLTKAEIAANIVSMQQALAAFNTDSQRQARVKFAGINA